MSHSALALGSNRPLATSFFGGADRGKVIQFHMWPHQLDASLDLLVEDPDLPTGVGTLCEWIQWNNEDADMFLFDGGEAEPKVATVPVTSF